MNILSDTYSTEFLDASWKWLNDPELKKLTDTAEFTIEDQRRWFERLNLQNNYKIWGIRANQNPIGAYGIKNIAGKEGEFWGYIGDKQYWGLGIGHWMIETAEQKAKEDGLKTLYLKVCYGNYRAINLYFKHAFTIKNFKEPHYIMIKSLHYLLLLLSIKLVLLHIIVQHIV